MSSQPTAVASLAGLDDGTLAARIAQGDHVAFEALMRRHNGRFFRVARAILKDDAEAEDALQDAYLDAYRHIGGVPRRGPGSTWLTRIVVNQALMRLRRRKRDRVVVPFRERGPNDRGSELDPAEADVADETSESPPGATLRGELRRLLERRIDDLPVAFRTVFVMRDVEEMSVRRRPRGSPSRQPPCAPACSGLARCSARRWPATSTPPPSTCSASPASAAIASWPACSPRSPIPRRRRRVPGT